MIAYRHSFDLGMFYLYKDNLDGTALFYQVIEVDQEVNYVKLESRLIKYKWDSMGGY